MAKKTLTREEEVRAYARSGDFSGDDPFCYVDTACNDRTDDPPEV